MTQELEKIILEKRPNISKSSVKTYDSILRNLYYKVFEDKDIDIKKFDDSKKIINFLKGLEPNKRKSILSALVVITDNNDYRHLMLDDIKEYNKNEAKQSKTENQKENWVNTDELKNLYTILEKNANLIYKKDNITPTDYQDIQNYIILSLFNGEYIPPRRAKDYVDFKIKDIDKKKDNYKDKKTFIFNSYKTAKTYGEQMVIIPPKLNTIINKWIKINPTDYLLFDISFKPLSNVKLNQRLNKIFGKKAGVNQMRKTFLSNKYGDTIELKNEMEKDFKDMGSSMAQENIYIKK